MFKYDKRHGGPYDRGAADSYYNRGHNPHFFKGATYNSKMVSFEEMTAAEVAAYYAGYDDNEANGNKKDQEGLELY